MANNLLKRVLLFTFALLLLQITCAQEQSGNTAKRRVYKKSSGDSVRLRVDTVKKKKSKSGVVKSAKKPSRKSAAKRGKRKKETIDSVRFVQKEYSFGERVIMRGDSGKDVRKLAEILVNNLYIDEKQLLYTKSGALLYDGELVKAVMRFQEYNGFYPDGIVGKKLIKVLKKL